jgi:hypothetical protein
MESSDFSKRGRNNGLSVMFRIKISSYLNRRNNMTNDTRVGLTPYAAIKRVIERELPDLIVSDACSNYSVVGSNEYLSTLWIRNCGTIIVPQRSEQFDGSEGDPVGWFNGEIRKFRRIQERLKSHLRFDPRKCVDHDLETLNLVSANTVYDIKVGRGKLIFDTNGDEETVLEENVFDRVHIAFYDKTWAGSHLDRQKRRIA